MRPKYFFPPVIALTLFAQTPAPEQPVNRTNSRLVEVNVVVHDKTGPITNLTQSDFTLFDKGKEQKISSFVVSRNAAPNQQNLPSNVFTNRPDPASGPAGQTVVLLDALNTPVESQAFARMQFMKVLNEIKPQDRVAVYVLGTQLKVLNDLGGRDPEGDSNLEAWLTDNSVAGGMNIEHQLRTTVDALVTIASHVGRLRGRKNLVWVAGAYPVSVDHYGAEGPPGWETAAVQQTSASKGGMNRATGDPTQLDRAVFQKLFAPAMQALNFANIAVYSVDARGLVDMPTSQTAGGTGGSSSRSRASTAGDVSLVPSGTNAIRVLVEDSGGRVFQSSNDIQKAIRAAITDASVTYTLGYYPDSKMFDSRFHDLKVQVTRKDADLHYRKGYVALPESKTNDAQRTEAIRQAILSPLASDAIGLMAGYEKVEQPKLTLRTTVVITAADLTLEQKDNQWVGELELVLSPRGQDGKDRGTIRQGVGLKLTPEQYETVIKQGLSLNKTLEPTGEVTELRAIVADRISGRVGSLIMPIKK